MEHTSPLPYHTGVARRVLNVKDAESGVTGSDDHPTNKIDDNDREGLCGKHLFGTVNRLT